MMTRRFLLFLAAFLLLGAGGFFIAISTSNPTSSPFSSLPADPSHDLGKDSASLSLSISDDPVVLEAELNDTHLDTFEEELEEFDRELETDD